MDKLINASVHLNIHTLIKIIKKLILHFVICVVFLKIQIIVISKRDLHVSVHAK